MRLGSDPEVFLINRQNQRLKSVIGLVGANKWNPKQIDTLPLGYTLQEDNVALEFGIPPAASKEEFISNIRTVMRAGLQTLPGTRFSRLSCSVFPAEEMEHPSAYVFGCEPDFNAWTGEENIKPTPPHMHMRSAGGHVHVETSLPIRSVIQSMDLHLGVSSVLMDNGVERRQLYGKAGAYRPKPYGGEYRTLSNWWIYNKRVTGWVWDMTERALDFVASGRTIAHEDGLDIQDVINNGDKELAKLLVKEYNLTVL